MANTFCENCGALLSPDSKFCSNCGRPVPEAVEPVTQSPVAGGFVGTLGGEGMETEDDNAAVAGEPDVSRTAPEEAPENNAGSSEPPGEQTPPARQPAPPYRPPLYQQTFVNGDIRPPKGSKYEPISTAGFIGIMLLLGIPVVNLIFLIVWACGGCRKLQKTYMARAALILAAIGLIISIAFAVAFGSRIHRYLNETGYRGYDFYDYYSYD